MRAKTCGAPALMIRGVWQQLHELLLAELRGAGRRVIPVGRRGFRQPRFQCCCGEFVSASWVTSGAPGLEATVSNSPLFAEVIV